MDRYELPGNLIADALSVRANTVTDWRNAEVLPAIDGERIGQIIDGLNTVAESSSAELLAVYGLIDYSDLIYQDAYVITVTKNQPEETPNAAN